VVGHQWLMLMGCDQLMPESAGALKGRVTYVDCCSCWMIIQHQKGMLIIITHAGLVFIMGRPPCVQANVVGHPRCRFA
jgi:hypothetical protein